MWLTHVDALSEANLHILVVKHSVVVVEKVQAKDPVRLMRPMHDLDDTLVDIRCALKPHVAVDAILDAVNRKVDVGNRLVLLLCAVAHRQSVFQLLALELAFEEVSVDHLVVVLRHQIERGARVNHDLLNDWYE